MGASSERGRGPAATSRQRRRPVAGRCARLLSVVLSAGLLVLCGPSASVQADTFYVRVCPPEDASECSDTNDGRSPQTAWATLRKAATYVNQFGNPGDVVIAGPGVYAEGDVSLARPGLPPRLGAPARPIVFRADPGGGQTGDAPGPVTVDAAGAYDTGFLISGASDVVVSGFRIARARVAGVQVRSNAEGETADRAVIANNIIVANGGNHVGRGVDVLDGREVLVFNNFIADNASVGISVGGIAPGSPYARIINNTVAGHRPIGGVGFGIVIGAGRDESSDEPSASPGAWLLNNIVTGNDIGIDVKSRSICDYLAAFNLVNAPNPTNAYGASTPHDPSDIHGDAALVERSDGTYALALLGQDPGGPSPAIDAGSEAARVLGLDDASTRLDGAPDSSRVDIGYHADNRDYPLLEAAPIVPASLYVRAAGSDFNDGSSPQQALRSIQRALDTAPAGTTIVVGPGTYAPAAIGSTTLGRASPVDLQADPSGSQTGDAAGPVLVDGGGNANGLRIVGYCSTRIEGFTVTNAVSGVRIEQADHSVLRNNVSGANLETGFVVKNAPGALVRDNVSVSNRKLGIEIVDSDDVAVTNNLVYGNGTRGSGGGIQVGGTAGSRRAVIQNNTVYGNGANGLLIGTGGVASPGALVRYNLIAANGKNGIQLDNNNTGGISAIGYCAGYNINTDGYAAILSANCAACSASTNVSAPCSRPPCRPQGGSGCTIRPLDDLTNDPALVNPRGVDGCLGGRWSADDDFHLQQIAAGQTIDSPAVDFSADVPVTLELDARSTRTDGVPDANLVDVGYHYPAVPFVAVVPPPGDCNRDGRITVDEVVVGLDIALGARSLASCPSLDRDGDGRVMIDEIVRVIGDLFCS